MKVKMSKDEYDTIYKMLDDHRKQIAKLETDMDVAIRYIGRSVDGLRDRLIVDYKDAVRKYREALTDPKLIAGSTDPMYHPEYQHKQRADMVAGIYWKIYNSDIADDILLGGNGGPQ